MRVSPKALAPQAFLPLPALLLAACAVTSTSTPPAGFGPAAVCVEPATATDPGPKDGYVRRPSAYGPGAGRTAQRGYYDRPERVPPHEAGRYERSPNGRISFLLGRRTLDDPFFDTFGSEPVDEPGVLGIEFSQVTAPGTLGFEFGVNFGGDVEDDFNGLDTELFQAEIYAGARAEFGQGPIRPYIGGGGVLLSSTISQETFGGRFENDDSTFGGYIHGGIQADINDYVFLGLDYRHVFADDYDFGALDVDGDYDQISFVIGMTL